MLLLRWWVGSSLLLLSLVSPWAAAQGARYSCVIDGQVVSSRAPCVPAAEPTPAPAPVAGPRQYGGAAPIYASGYPRPYQGAVSEAEEHVKYLGAECARISEGIRTGPQRGVPYGVIADLRKEYQRKCQDEEREARVRAGDDQKRRRDNDRAARTAGQQASAQSARDAAQCDEMLRSLTNKRRRIDTLNAGERDDLARFQAQYDQRCKRAQ